MHKLTLEKTYTCVSREWQYLCIGDNMKTMKVTDWGGGGFLGLYNYQQYIVLNSPKLRLDIALLVPQKDTKT